MLEYIQFLRDIYKDLRTNAQRAQMLHNLILTEARFNNDLLQIIQRTGADATARATPGCFLELQTSSAELVAALGIPAHTVFDDRRDPTEDELLRLDQRGVSLKSLNRRPQTELWEYSMRKIRLLKALAQADGLTTTRIALPSRCRNLEYATRSLVRRMTR